MIANIRLPHEIKRIKGTVVKPGDPSAAYLKSKGTKTLTNGVYLDQLLKRAELDYGVVENLAPAAVEIEQKSGAAGGDRSQIRGIYPASAQ